MRRIRSSWRWSKQRRPPSGHAASISKFGRANSARRRNAAFTLYNVHVAADMARRTLQAMARCWLPSEFRGREQTHEYEEGFEGAMSDFRPGSILTFTSGFGLRLFALSQVRLGARVDIFLMVSINQLPPSSKDRAVVTMPRKRLMR
jgi:hypothetical protein